MALRSRMTLLLPKTFPRGQAPRDYVFGHNETHMALSLDYGSIINHHESFNVEAVNIPGSEDVHFQVRMGCLCENRNFLKNMQYAVCMHT